MPNSYIPVYIHFVWATFDRQPLIKLEWENRLYAAIARKCEELRIGLVAANGTENHIHVLVRFNAVLTLAQIAQHLKGATSHLINHELAPGSSFRWQGSYSAHPVERGERLDIVAAYIRNQKQRHAENSVFAERERTEE